MVGKLVHIDVREMKRSDAVQPVDFFVGFKVILPWRTSCRGSGEIDKLRLELSFQYFPTGLAPSHRISTQLGDVFILLSQKLLNCLLIKGVDLLLRCRKPLSPLLMFLVSAVNAFSHNQCLEASALSLVLVPGIIQH